jgi:hypothetical protein
MYISMEYFPRMFSVFYTFMFKVYVKIIKAFTKIR